MLFRMWQKEEGIHRARAHYSLAMLYARHHPLALKSDLTAEQLLNEAWDILINLDEETEQVIYEQIFNRNGIALIYYRRGDYETASKILEAAIAKLQLTTFRDGLHNTVLLNNLGRVYSASGEYNKAEKYLKAAIELDPKFAEYWTDLAFLYLEIDKIEDALFAAHQAEKCSSTISEIPELIGYLLNKKGDYAKAANAYVRAWQCEPLRSDIALGAAYNFCEAGLYNEAKEWIDKVDVYKLTADQQETMDLLILELKLNRGEIDDKHSLKQELEILLAKYPHSEAIHENLEKLFN
ncbi:MAG: TPR repeat [Candidatus Carbobacillus altaicus]|uniref:TPR repeat n=1 Tax=Candidatus Carbonibacillus altaicus TaxID=2163959 RepID=A0A2R6XY46_9BACL|nr:MAG: TPR repeat [Candidatus Carbobacillus altaicus]